MGEMEVSWRVMKVVGSLCYQGEEWCAEADLGEDILSTFYTSHKISLMVAR